MARVLRGQIYWADLGRPRGHEQEGLRPVLVLSHETFNARSGTAIVLTITSQPQRAGYPLTLRLQSGRLPKPSWVKISQIRTVSTERLRKPLGTLSPEELGQIVEGFLELVG